MLPPIISTTPNSPTVCAKPSTAAVRKPGRASGRATGEAAQPLVFFGGSYRNLDARTRVEPLPSEHWWIYAW